jgi:O-antigen polymerase
MPELMQSTQTGKFFSFAYSLLAVVVLFLLYNLFSTRPIKVIITLLDILLGLLFLYIIINRYLFHESWGFGLAVFYFLLRRMSNSMYPWLMLAVIISGIIQAVYGNLQLYGYYPSHHSGFRMTGSFLFRDRMQAFWQVFFRLP